MWFVFALTITLVVATTLVPQTFPEIWGVFLDAPVLAACFTLLVLLWHDHYLFCRRYGLEDAPTTALNLVLLFLVLVSSFLGGTPSVEPGSALVIDLQGRYARFVQCPASISGACTIGVTPGLM